MDTSRKTLPTPLLTMLLAAALVLAGCAGTGDDGLQQDDAGVPPADDNGGASGAQTPQAPGNGSETEEPPQDPGNDTETYASPVPRLEASVLEGEPPLAVEFTVDADTEDGRAFLWTLDIDGDVVAQGDEEGLPVTVEHTFEEAGTYTATLTVDDGQEAATATRAIQVTEPTIDAPDPVVIEGGALVPTVTGLVLLCIGDGVDGGLHDLAPAGPGWSYSLEPDSGFQIFWWSGGSYQSNADGPVGTVPDGIDQAEICSISEVAADYRMTLYAPGHPDAPV